MENSGKMWTCEFGLIKIPFGVIVKKPSFVYSSHFAEARSRIGSRLFDAKDVVIFSRGRRELMTVQTRRFRLHVLWA